MTFEIAKKDGKFWAAYYENVDERLGWGDDRLTPNEFYEVWLDKGNYEQSIIPTN